MSFLASSAQIILAEIEGFGPATSIAAVTAFGADDFELPLHAASIEIIARTHAPTAGPRTEIPTRLTCVTCLFEDEWAV